MESDLGKLFIGGISWDTDEERLRDYFSKFGDVMDAIIMKDRSTGRGRGFGFVVFADPGVAEQVVMEKHTIDGRAVEAKKAVPRDDRSVTCSLHGSPGGGRTKKIFVGGLPSTLTESEFKVYFDQFGKITDVVVMYDHNTQRPRGFGFITYDSEDAVDNALVKPFHELNGKMVEVKRAVPKEQSPVANVRSSVGGYNYGLNQPNSINSGYSLGYNPSLIGGYGMRMDGRLGPLTVGRTGLPSLGPGFGMGINLEPRLTPSFGGNTSLNYNLAYGRALDPYYSVNSSRYNSTIGYGGGSASNSSLFSSVARNIWSDGSNSSLNYDANLPNSDSYMASGTNGFGNSNLNWSGSSISASSGGRGLGYTSGNIGHANSVNNFNMVGSNFGRNGGVGSSNASLVTSSGGFEGPYGDLYGGSSLYGDPTWRSSSPELADAGPFSYGLGNASSDTTRRNSAGYMGGYNISNSESNRDR